MPHLTSVADAARSDTADAAGVDRVFMRRVGQARVEQQDEQQLCEIISQRRVFLVCEKEQWMDSVFTRRTSKVNFLLVIMGGEVSQPPEWDVRRAESFRLQF